MKVWARVGMELSLPDNFITASEFDKNKAIADAVRNKELSKFSGETYFPEGIDENLHLPEEIGECEFYPEDE